VKKVPIASKSLTASRLGQLRELMVRHDADACIIPSTDEHLNEYLPHNRERRTFITGFTGSMGDCLVTANSAWLFVDSRYYQQADHEVDASLIHIQKLGLPGVFGLIEQLGNSLQLAGSSKTVAVDPFSISVEQGQQLQSKVQLHHGIWKPTETNWIDEIWSDQPATVLSEVIALPDSVTGQTVQEKLTQLQQQLKVAKVDLLPLTKLDQIAWLLNLRGQDIPYNPLFTAYMLIGQQTATLFCDTQRFTMGALAHCPSTVQVLPYTHYLESLTALSPNSTVWITPRQQTLGTLNTIQANGGLIENKPVHPVDALKMIKNPTELTYAGMANAKASRAKIRALYWLSTQLEKQIPVSEARFANCLEQLYRQEDGFMGLSFNTISATGSNGSIVHYGTPDENRFLTMGELFLIDSGCQFMGGTTDDTRTVLVGDQATPLQKKRYTAVLKAHIHAASQCFPKGTDGAAIDAITRSPLWNAGLDYGHGTGHGVGAFLNVHEGPNGIHRLAKTPLAANMINSIEPGFYEPGWGGIRLENLYQVVTVSSSALSEHPETEAKTEKRVEDTSDWLAFKSLTFIPFDAKLIEWTTLTTAEAGWLKNYYQQILLAIKPTLPPEEQRWLEHYCIIPV
jgi:Xaa-Pro aminopeptidase